MLNTIKLIRNKEKRTRVINKSKQCLFLTKKQKPTLTTYKEETKCKYQLNKLKILNTYQNCVKTIYAKIKYCFYPKYELLKKCNML